MLCKWEPDNIQKVMLCKWSPGGGEYREKSWLERMGCTVLFYRQGTKHGSPSCEKSSWRTDLQALPKCGTIISKTRQKTKPQEFD